ncbi:aminotransferase class I/II-fold pyridoxal phosphate-dependent enzyme [Aquimarina sp. AD1]|uniref:methionine aminotransferase n=1 Tax=Aquimarina sp. (strain AD1) TaxID=1714848 RepID=UPI000E4D0A31|nr:methionine aminotransferase [Aquimarina sp. AD1]AXT57577.1 aminotransferase class I/II-fold pyridoxal phosphate-dependent enzyme [Aquimarina sp. AD1]RKN35130.1 aminotransferase class I/II-fold pyridoxal phosphate-dependent enzyme [Aquimarina sp. AD1]
MRHIHSKLPEVSTTIFTVMSNMANEYKAINLSQGFPNFETDSKLTNLVTNAMQKGYNQYAPMPGLVSLREIIAEKTNTLYNSNYLPDTEVTVTSGATQAIFTIISAFIRQGDEVIIFKPAYDSYEPSVKLFGGKVIPVQLSTPNFTVDWHEVANKITSKTKMIIINTPHNPTGTILSKEDMLKLENLLKGTDIILLSDEVYEHIIFDSQPHQSVAKFPGLSERAFITASFGKTFHTTGWKMGYCIAPKELMKEFRKVHQFNVFCSNHPMQYALAEYLKTPENYMSLPNFYQEKRDLFLSLIKDSRFSYVPAAGTYFQLLDYSNITDEGDVTFAERLTKEYKIASIPVSVFNLNQQDDKVLRFCFAKTDDTLKSAAEILCSI